MKTEKRIYDALLDEHLATHRQMAFVTGPRQVGKTTTCRNHAQSYINWDNIDDREQILAGLVVTGSRCASYNSFGKRSVI